MKNRNIRRIAFYDDRHDLDLGLMTLYPNDKEYLADIDISYMVHRTIKKFMIRKIDEK